MLLYPGEADISSHNASETALIKDTSHGHVAHGHLSILSFFALTTAFKGRALYWRQSPPLVSVTQPLVFLLPLWSWRPSLNSWSIWLLRCSSSSLRHPQISQMPYVPYRSTDMYAPAPIKLEVVWDSEVPIHHHILPALHQNCILHLLAIDSSPPWSMSLPLLPTDMSASFLPFSTKQTEPSLKISWMSPFLLISKERADSSPWPTRSHTLLQVPNAVFFSLFSVH